MKRILAVFMSLTFVLGLAAPAASAKPKENSETIERGKSLHVQIVLFDGFDLLDVMAPYEVFAAAGMYTDGAVTVELVSAEGKRTVPSGLNGPSLEAEAALDPNRPGIIVVPGAAGKPAGNTPDAIPNLLWRAKETSLPDKIKQAFKNEKLTVATVCGGSLLLAMDGLLKDRHAVTHPIGMEALKAAGAIPVQARIVEDSPRFVSGGGVTSGLDVALYLVEREVGPQIANAIEELFVYEQRGTVWRAEGMTPVDFVKQETSKEKQ